MFNPFLFILLTLILVIDYLKSKPIIYLRNKPIQIEDIARVDKKTNSVALSPQENYTTERTPLVDEI
jgi:hypothetical protein